MPHIDVVTERVIDRPVADVAAFAGDPRNAPRWYSAIDRVTILQPAPLAAGSRVMFEARFLRRRLVYTYEVVELIEGKKLVMRSAEGPFPMETTYEWEPAGASRTRMRLRNRGEPHGFATAVAPVLASAIRLANAKDLARLAALVEVS